MINTLRPAIALLSFNLQWHTQVIKDTLLRYKLFVLFIILTLVPTLSGLHDILTLPTKGLFNPDATMMQYMISLSSYLGIGLIWLTLQKNIISNQPWDKYLVTLPLTNIQKTIYEAATLLVANSIIWIPLFLAAYSQINSHLVNNIIALENVLTYIALVVLFQLTFKTKSFAMMMVTFLAELPLLLVSHRSNDLTEIIVLIISILLSLFFMQMCFCKKLKNTSPSNIKIISSENTTGNLDRNFPFTRIQIKNLWDICADLVLLASSIVVVYLIAFCLMKYAQNNRELTAIISSLMLVNAVIISNLFVRLSDQRNQLFPYFASLPISKVSLYIKDLGVAGLCLSLVNAFTFVTGIFFLNNALTASVIITTLVMPMVLLSLSYFPQSRFKKYGFLISLIVMSFFIWCNYLLLTTSQ